MGARALRQHVARAGRHRHITLLIDRASWYDRIPIMRRDRALHPGAAASERARSRQVVTYRMVPDQSSSEKKNRQRGFQ
jgi:hypothetical protein